MMKRRVALRLSIVKCETSVEKAARAHGRTVAEVKEGPNRFLVGAEMYTLLFPTRKPETVGQETYMTSILTYSGTTKPGSPRLAD